MVRPMAAAEAAAVATQQLAAASVRGKKTLAFIGAGASTAVASSIFGGLLSGGLHAVRVDGGARPFPVAASKPS